MSTQEAPQGGTDGVRGRSAGERARSSRSRRSCAAYEAELSRITSADMVLQATVSLLNIGARRLGLVGGPEGAGRPAAPGARPRAGVRRDRRGARPDGSDRAPRPPGSACPTRGPLPAADGLRPRGPGGRARAGPARRASPARRRPGARADPRALQQGSLPPASQRRRVRTRACRVQRPTVGTRALNVQQGILRSSARVGTATSLVGAGPPCPAASRSCSKGQRPRGPAA